MISSLDLGLICNGRIGALINDSTEIVWCCMPRFDGDPVFYSPLKEHHAGEEFGYRWAGRMLIDAARIRQRGKLAIRIGRSL